MDAMLQILQVKLPVTDLRRSTQWYRRAFDLRLWIEFVEDGELVGAGLIDDAGGFNVALRDRQHCAGQPTLTGFDVVAFRPASREALEQLAARCDDLGIAHSGLRPTPDGCHLDIPDPDGTVLRFYHYTGATSGYRRIEFVDGQLHAVAEVLG